MLAAHPCCHPHAKQVGYSRAAQLRETTAPKPTSAHNPSPVERVDVAALKPGRTYNVRVLPVCEWADENSKYPV